MRTGTARVPLHGGKAPRWLFQRMVRLAREVVIHLVEEYGPEEVLVRLSDPYWFQAFGCVLGFDWHSSGVTTTTCGAVKEGIKGLEADLGLYAAGGKGAASRRTPAEIENHCEHLGHDPSALVKASRLSAKVDNSAVQDGYQLYHHCLFFTRDRHWCVVQQGMNDANGTARRYHWLGSGVESFVNEPHAAVCCDRRHSALNLVAAESQGAREAIAELAARPNTELERVVDRLPELVLPRRHPVRPEDVNPRHLHRILLKTYERMPEDFETLLGIQGVGPKALRALSLVAELIYGQPASTHDPARFSFAHGGKDGTPYPVDRAGYDRTIEILKQAVDRSMIDRSHRIQALKRLARFEGAP
ncbi:MAG TPA: DUF763 domain-containing protein [Chromatiales bacterium]|nr:DUF763 domain-containing protein [Chromatiales bacterium]